jgi:hypothetical protein
LLKSPKCQASRYLDGENAVFSTLARCRFDRNFERVTKMPLAENDDVIKALWADRSDQPLRNPFCQVDRAEIGRSRISNESVAVSAIAITNDTARWLLPPAGLGQLTGNPLGRRMRGHTQ